MKDENDPGNSIKDDPDDSYDDDDQEHSKEGADIRDVRYKLETLFN